MSVGEALALADRCRTEQRLQEAEALCRDILQKRPNSPEAEHLLGLVAHQDGRLGEAIQHVQRAIELTPRVALFHANLGEMQRLAGRPRLAVKSARRALAIDPHSAMALSNLGVALYELKDYKEAARAHRRAIAAKPDFAAAHNNLGNALYGLRRLDEAAAAYRCALDLEPDYADALANLGTTLHHSGQFDDGITTLRYAIALSPHHANAHSGLGILLLMRGDLGEGWDEYEWRLRSTERKGPRFPERPWQGENPAGKHIYVQAEQGFGDTLHFARYIPLLVARARQVTLRAHQQLVALLRESLPGVTVLGDRADPAPYDYDAVLLSLPRLFKTRLETIPAELPYLRVPTATRQRWQKRLAALDGIKIGMVWAGNPEHANDARRSLALSLLSPLFAVLGTSFASLQVGPRATDIKKLKRSKSSILDLSPQLTDFVETAGAVAALDLVITVDTSVAHLAGALGKPVWLLLPSVTDWRWMLNREDSPWYPSMRLFRQRESGHWPDVIARMVVELQRVAKGEVSSLTPFEAEGVRRAARASAIIAAEAAQAGKPTPAPAQTMSPGETLILAEQKRRRGFLGDADELARRALVAKPDNAEAVHTLGLVAHQSGRLDEAIEHMLHAVALNPEVAVYHANLGEMCRLAGRIDEAIAAGRRALELKPDYQAALSNLGIALFDQGKFEEAIEHYDRALAQQDDFVQAHSNRGNALQRLKRYGEAEAAYRRALKLQPDFTDAWNNLGTCVRELGRLEEAEAAYRKALERQPNNPEILDNLALAVKDLDRLDEAAELLRRGLSIDARLDKLHVHYASVLFDQHKVEEAVEAAERALALDAGNYDAINLLGRVAFERGDLEAAIAHSRHAIALKPDLTDAHNNLGNALREAGRLREAQTAYLDALRLGPEVSGVYLNLADLKTFAPGDPHLSAMEALAAKPDGLSNNDRMHFDFALGKAYADLKDSRRSFVHLRDGNAAKRAMIFYDETATFSFFDRLEAIFTRDLIRTKTGGGDPSPMPIFVIGMPRSGTTLVEQILASHPAVYGAGELKTLDNIVQAVSGPDGSTRAYPEFMPALDAASLRAMGADYVAAVRKLAPRSERVTDKMPSNYYYVGLIHLALPNAKIVHCIRDPVDTCVSCFSKLFSDEQLHTYDLAELGRYYRRYERLMAHWRRVLPAAAMLNVRYEDVVADLKTQARRIISYCGLPWDDRCLAFYQTKRPVRTASATQVRQPIYKTAIGRWRVYEKELGPLLSALGIDATAD